MIRKLLASLASLALCSSAFAAGSTAWAVPTQIDVTYAGIMVYGSFGNTGGCTVADRFFVPINTGQYIQIHATLLTAFTAGKQVSAYVSSCDAVTWYSAPSVTYNYMVSSGIVYVRN